MNNNSKPPNRIYAPFTESQVKGMNAWQQSDFMHPLTCCNNRTDAAHQKYQRAHGGDYGQLIATEAGLFCPACGFKQTWAFDFMTL